jgi:hypothetical protein
MTAALHAFPDMARSALQLVLVTWIAIPTIARADAEEANVSVQVKACTGVVDHAAVGETASFPTGTVVWIWSRISNGPREVKHVWKRGAEAIWTATLAVRSTEWTTMSRRALAQRRMYTVDVATPDGVVLAEISFDVR